MGWIWDAAVALFTLLAVGVAFWAAWQARRANRLVGVYRRALWRVTILEYPEAPEEFGVMLHNEGESPALNVTFTLLADPRHMFGGREAIGLVPPKSSEVVRLNLPPRKSGIGTVWSSFFSRDDVDTRAALIAWTDLEGEPRTQDVVMPLALPA